MMDTIRHASHRARGPRRARAFTLIEMVIVITTMFILLGILVVMAGRVIEEQRVATTRQAIDAIEAGMDIFYSRNGKFPEINKNPFTGASVNSEMDAGDPDVVRDYLAMQNLMIYLTNDRWGRCLENISPEALGETIYGQTVFVDAWGRAILVYVPEEWALRDDVNIPSWMGDAGEIEDQRQRWALNGGRPYIWSLGPDGAGWRIDVAGYDQNLARAGNANELKDYFYLEDDEEDNGDNVSNFRDIPID